MNKEEAIRILRKEIECLSHAKCEDCILKKVCDPAKTTPLDSEYIEAYSMAIQALSQEPICDRDCEHCTWTECPIEPCDDAISREAVKDILNNSYSLTDAEHRVEQLPSVTQKSETVTEFADRCRECGAKYGKMLEQKSGKWIKQTLSVKPFGEDTVLCDQCAFMTDRDSMYNYCPNCGARMESEVNNG